MWLVCLLDVLFSALKSKVLLGAPFGTITILTHKIVDVLRGTGLMIPKATSLSCLTLSSQWSGMGTGVWCVQVQVREDWHWLTQHLW